MIRKLVSAAKPGHAYDYALGSVEAKVPIASVESAIREMLRLKSEVNRAVLSDEKGYSNAPLDQIHKGASKTSFVADTPNVQVASSWSD